jgi:hypothetical protein
MIGKIRLGVEVLAVLLLLGWAWNMYNKAPVVVGESIVSAPTSLVVKAGTEDTPIAVPIKTVRGGAKLKAKLHLPNVIQIDDMKKVLDSVDVPEDGRKHRVTAVIDTDTGKTNTYVEAMPLDWFRFRTNGSIGAYAGVSDLGETARLQAKQTLFSIKALDFGAIASVDQAFGSSTGANAAPGTRFFLGVGAEYRW